MDKNNSNDDSYERSEAELLKAADELETKVKQAKISRRDKIRQGWHDNKKVILIGAGCLVVGAAIGVLATQGKNIVITDSFKIQWRTKTENVVVTILERRGHPGNKILCKETGEIFASQTRAAAVNKVDPGQLSKHLKGKMPHVKGLTFENLGEMV